MLSLVIFLRVFEGYQPAKLRACTCHMKSLPWGRICGKIIMSLVIDLSHSLSIPKYG